MTRFCFTLPISLLLVFVAHTQQIKMLSAGNRASLRGLSVPNDKVIWVCGSAGTAGLSTDGGISWKWITVAGFEKTDFRDVEAFSDQEAVIMGTTLPAVILKTKDGGKTWKTVFEDSSKYTFLDAMDFSGDQGIVIGDPVNNRLFLAETKNGGEDWEIRRQEIFSLSEKGEAFFAASGSNIKWLPGHHYACVSGGKKSSLYLDSAGKFLLALSRGEETTGANSIAVNPANPNQGFVTGGDFSNDGIINGNALRIRFHPFQQQKPNHPPHGYRSCVEYISDQTLICCGTSGVDISADGGMNWKLISTKSFHVCGRSKSGRSVFLAGAHGAIARLIW